MKVKMLSRNLDNRARETKLDLQKVPRNYDPTLDPFELVMTKLKQWKMDGPGYGEEEEPLHTILGKTVYTGIDHHWKEALFVTWGQQGDIWDEKRTSPVCSMT
ncbi:hypothetical protein MC885_013184 [Smutsia gigantea]|nr:hypothetical protein MC885_013184 [Smutsia gigantea]